MRVYKFGKLKKKESSLNIHCVSERTFIEHNVRTFKTFEMLATY